jgi:hypothetical protein
LALEECTWVLANPWSSSVGITYEVGEKLLEEKVPQVGGCVLLGTGALALLELLDTSTELAVLHAALDGLDTYKNV